MNGCDTVSPLRIEMNLCAKDKASAIKELVSLFCRTQKRTDEEELYQAVMEREARLATGLQWGVALPHARTSAVSQIFVTIGFSRSGIPFGAQDGIPAHTVILILSPEDDLIGHVRFLADLSTVLNSSRLRECLQRAESPQEAAAVFKGVLQWK